MSLEAFRQTIGSIQDGFAEAHSEDRLLFNIARTWRVGPEPEYLTVWGSDAGGLRRLDEWEALYAAGEEPIWNEPFRLAGRMDGAGCYVALTEYDRGDATRHYLEFFDVEPDAGRADVTNVYRERAESFPDQRLSLLLDRVGALGPQPRGLAFWEVESFAQIGELAETFAPGLAPIRPRAAGLYADLGLEIR